MLWRGRAPMHWRPLRVWDERGFRVLKLRCLCVVRPSRVSQAPSKTIVDRLDVGCRPPSMRARLLRPEGGWTVEGGGGEGEGFREQCHVALPLGQQQKGMWRSCMRVNRRHG